MIFYKDKQQIISFDETFFDIDKKITGKSSDVFDISNKIIKSDNSSNFKDNFNNIIKLSSFKYFNNSELLKANNIELTDEKKNKYFIKKVFLN